MFDIKKSNLFEVFDPKYHMRDERTGKSHPSRYIVRDILKDLDFDSILDVPCGPGLDYEIFEEAGLLKGKKYLGVDYTSKFMDFWAKDRGVDTMKGDIRDLSFSSDNSFDVVHARGIFEHLDGDDYKVAMAECLRVAKKYVFFIFYRGAGKVKGKVYNSVGIVEQDYTSDEIEAQFKGREFKKWLSKDSYGDIYTIYLINK
jgi:SAM-dependent methyltransferase